MLLELRKDGYMNILKRLNLNNINDLYLKLKWMFSYSKPVLPFLLVTILINCILSFINVYGTLVSKSLIDFAIERNTKEVIKWLVIMASIMVLNMCISPITTFIYTHAYTKLTQNIQKNLYIHLMHGEWLYESKFHSVSLLTRITSDIDTISNMILKIIPNIISLLTTIAASFSTLLFLAPSLAVCSIIIGPFLFIVSKLLGKKVKDIYKESQEIDIQFRTFIQETLQNIMIVKTFCMEKHNKIKLESIQKNKYNIAMKNTKLSTLTCFSIDFCSALAYFTVFCWGALNISKGTSTYGTFTAMLQLYNTIQYPIKSLGNLFPSVISSIAATERLIEIENIPIEKCKVNKLSSLCKYPSINLENIYFQYDQSKPVLENINLNLEPGEIIALIGASGEGKTTLIRILLSLATPNSGSINIFEDNKYSLINKNYRDLISYVPQGNTLFSGTIEENLKYGNSNASGEEINEALKKSCAFDFVNNFKNGINTIIGEKGLGLSEGQSQRLAIARAFLRKKPILILDEATSALDSNTEFKILHEIRNLSNTPTCIIITHRFSSLNICNRIYKLDKGSLSEFPKDYLSEIANELI